MNAFIQAAQQILRLTDLNESPETSRAALATELGKPQKGEAGSISKLTFYSSFCSSFTDGL